MMTLYSTRSRLAALALTVAAAALVAGCDEEQLATGPGRSLQPIPPETVALMEKLDTSPSSPVLIRTYKKEAEFEIWKMKSDGQYVLLKTYPMCRWSGQLGPKKSEGDRQVPEGFYPITPGQMNPNSNYYLSFNVGYPNAYDHAWGRTGGTIMVHGACSSAGCFSMTDQQIAEIYSIAREAFNGGQSEIQMQSYPFHMTAENLAKHRLDPNIDFWKELKNGADHFEVTKTEPQVLVCDKHYVFGATAEGDVSATAPCPALQKDDDVEVAVAAKQADDDQQVAKLVADGVKPIRLVYMDGGQNKAFAGREDSSAPEALVDGPQEVVIDPSAPAKTIAATKIAAAPTPPAATPTPAAQSSNVAAATASVADQPADATPYAPARPAIGFSIPGVALLSGFLNGGQKSDATVFEPAQPIPSDVPLPPRRGDAPVAASAAPTSDAGPMSLAALKPRGKKLPPLDPSADDTQ